jgi:hypothetical protein
MAPPLTWYQKNELERKKNQFTHPDLQSMGNIPPAENNSFVTGGYGGTGSLLGGLRNLTIGSDGMIKIPGTGSGGDTKEDPGFGWNMGTANMISSGLGGLGNLARGWAAIKGLGIAEDQLDENKRQYNQNYAQQLRAFEGDRTRANTRIGDQNAWKTAQGRTDLGSLIV